MDKITNAFIDVLELEKKTIPSRVFYNHFEAISDYINSDLDKYKLKSNNFYKNQLKKVDEEFDLEKCKRLLWNSWSTEEAFLLSPPESTNDEYYKLALHWHFPQVYYSAYLNMKAFHETQVILNENHEKSIRVFGNSVIHGHYPKGMSFYACGGYKNFEYIGFDNFSGFPRNYNALSIPKNIDEIETQIANFLKTTRELKAKEKREGLKKSANKKFLNKKGELRKNFRQKEWDEIYKSISPTTIFNILYRLRIKANYLDVETFIYADIDFQRFHNNLGTILSYLNFVHEAYVCKAIGVENYQKILNDFSSRITSIRAKKRFEEAIKNI